MHGESIDMPWGEQRWGQIKLQVQETALFMLMLYAWKMYVLEDASPKLSSLGWGGGPIESANVITDELVSFQATKGLREQLMLALLLLNFS